MTTSSSTTPISRENAIRALVRNAVHAFASGFSARHEGEVSNPDGTINMKIHNVFIAALGSEIQYYTALVRSLDSSLGNMLEQLAIGIAELSFQVQKSVTGSISSEQINGIATLLENYKNRRLRPATADYQFLRQRPPANSLMSARHDSDYYLYDSETHRHHLIELKIGGDLDNKKARSEKEAILEQFAILANSLPEDAQITLHFATGYNRYGEDKEWRQERVCQFFARGELLIGRDFWNFVAKSPHGYEWVLGTYRDNAHVITAALADIKHLYLHE